MSCRPIICASLLVAALAWPAPARSSEPLVEETIEAGSGWSMTRRCLTDPATGDVACRSAARTAYAAFEGVRTAATPAEATNSALARLEPLECVAPDRDAATQAALWLLAEGDPLARPPSLDALVWHPGAPQRQDAVCLSLDDARALHGGLAWEPSGAEPEAPGPGESLVVRYAARWWDAGEGPRPDPAPRERLVVDALRFVVAGQALAVHDTARDRHAWLVNYAGGSEDGLKIDRYERIVGLVHDPGTDTVHVELSSPIPGAGALVLALARLR